MEKEPRRRFQSALDLPDEARDSWASFESESELDRHTRDCLAGWPPEEHELRIQEMEEEAIAISDPELFYWAATVLAYCGGARPALGPPRRAVRHNYCATEILAVDPLLASLRDNAGYAAEFEATLSDSKACQERFLAATGGI